MITRIPAFASAWAVALPMPRDAPVISAVFFELVVMIIVSTVMLPCDLAVFIFRAVRLGVADSICISATVSFSGDTNQGVVALSFGGFKNLTTPRSAGAETGLIWFVKLNRLYIQIVMTTTYKAVEATSPGRLNLVEFWEDSRQ